MQDLPIGIVAVGTYVPQTWITAAEIAELSGIPEDVIVTKFGLERKLMPGLHDHTNAMAHAACNWCVTTT